MDVPYNDDLNVFNRTNSFNNNFNNRADEIKKNVYNSNTGFILRNSTQNNILVGAYDPSNNNNSSGGLPDIYGRNTNSNIKSSNSNSGSSSRPSHKTHVEIITKNGATKKPNIITNNYNPELILTRTNFHHHHHSMNNLNKNVKNDASGDNSIKSLYERKSTCMLYLQADHTFFQKMGSEEASIEAITRHVQRANAIYKNTGILIFNFNYSDILPALTFDFNLSYNQLWFIFLDFNGDGKPDNITFMIKRIKVHTSNALQDTTYRFPGNYGVEKFLELFSGKFSNSY